MRALLRAVLPFALASAGCGTEGAESAAGTPNDAADEPRQTASVQCDEDDGGIELPEGFCALVVIDDAAPGRTRLRHIAVAPNGDIYVAVQGRRGAETPDERGGVLALRDTTGDGRADVEARFGPEGGTGMEIRDGYLYFGTNSAVLRYRLGDALEPAEPPDTIVHGLPDEHSHTAKSLALDGGNGLYVNVGSPTNACQPIGSDREPGVAGEDPCTQLETRAGVWRFDATTTGQRQADGGHWAIGIRNAVALAWNPGDRNLYAVQHNRDQLNIWPGFDAEDNAHAAGEEFQRVTRGSDFGWPYCYYDVRIERRVLAPEYGGDGEEVGRCAEKDDPLFAFPAHWAPNDLLFYTGSQFPERYHGGAFVAFHGSWDRAPLPQAGYNVSFVPFTGGEPATDYEVFAEGFTGVGAPSSPGDAEHRPMGLAEGPDGSLYITDSSGGRIWRVVYEGR